MNTNRTTREASGKPAPLDDFDDVEPVPLTPELVTRLEDVMHQAFEDHDRAVRDGICLECMERPVFVNRGRVYKFCATCATKRIFAFAESDDDE